MKNGYTLVEIMVVISILGILAALVAPRITGSQEAAIAGEAIQVLTALHASQNRYCLENPCPANGYPVVAGLNPCADYDIDFPTLNNFGVPQCAASGNIGLVRTGATYVLQVTPDVAGVPGVYSCKAGTACPAVGTCSGDCPGPIDRILPQ